MDPDIVPDNDVSYTKAYYFANFVKILSQFLCGPAQGQTNRGEYITSFVKGRLNNCIRDTRHYRSIAQSVYFEITCKQSIHRLSPKPHFN